MAVEEPDTKRFRGGDAVGIPEDRINVSASPVIHLRQLSVNTTEAQILQAMQQFGRVAYIVNIQPRRMALVEFEDISSATRCLEYSNSSTVIVGSGTALVNYSTSKFLNRKGLATEKPNKVLVLFVKNARYPMNVETLYMVCKPYGELKRIAINPRAEGTLILVEYGSVDAAKNAKYALNGADIYPGSNTIKAEYSKIENINVNGNSHDRWDFTIAGADFSPLAFMKPPPDPNPYGGGVMPACENEYGGWGRPMISGDRTSMGVAGSAGGALMSAPPYSDYPSFGATSSGAFGPAMGFSPFGESVTVMLCGTDHDNWNPHRVFNLLCLYGNIGKVKFMRAKPDSVMVEMGSAEQMNQAARSLNSAEAFSSPLSMRTLKQPSTLSFQRESFRLPSGVDGFYDFTHEARNQRFLTAEAASKNQIMAPTSALHFYNAPVDMTDEELIRLLLDHGADEPISIALMKSERSSRGFINFASARSATEALIKVNHAQIPSQTGRFPYTFKVAFTQPSRSVQSSG